MNWLWMNCIMHSEDGVFVFLVLFVYSYVVRKILERRISYSERR